MIDAFERTFGVHPGQRRNHIKGTCAAGEFLGTADAAALSRSALFSGKTIPMIAGFSLGGGSPEVPDAAPAPRGMALEFHLPGGALQHITMINVPIFGATSPASFRDLIVAAKPDPKTHQPDPQKLKAYADTHPDAMALTQLSSHHTPTANYYQTTFFSIHTFKFVDAKGAEHPVRWRFIPRDGTKEMTAAEMKAAPHDFLEKNLIERTGKGPSVWDMMVYVGEPGDPQAFHRRHADHHPSHAATKRRGLRADQLRPPGHVRRYRSDQRSRPAVPFTGLCGLVWKTPVGSVRLATDLGDEISGLVGGFPGTRPSGIPPIRTTARPA